MARWQQALATGLDVRPGEGEPLALLFLQSFLAGLCFVYFETAASTLFLSTFEVEALPFAYIATAVLATGVGALYGRCERRLPAARLLQATLALAALSVLVFAAACQLGPQRWLFAALMAWKEVLWMLFMLVFWGLAGCIFNLRQGKRLFPIAASGALLSGLGGGLTVAAVVGFAATDGLMLLSAVAALLALATGFWLTRRFAERLELAGEAEEDGPREESFAALLRRPYLRLFLAISVVSVVAYYALDYAFYAVVDGERPDEAQLATFFGGFYALVNLANLLASGLLAGRLISRFGIALVLCAVPLLVAVGSAAASLSAFVGVSGALLFGLVVATKLADEVLREAFDEPASRVLYQPLPLRLRLAVQAKRESIVEPVVGGVCALALLLLNELLGLAPLALLAAACAACVVWALLARRMGRAYARALEQAVSRRRLGRAGPLPADAQSLEILARRVLAPEAGEAIYALQLLEELQAARLDERLLAALEHPASEVRLFALERIESRGAASAEARLRERLAREPSPGVRGRLLRVLGASCEGELPEPVIAGLDDPDPDARLGAMAGLLRSGGIDGVILAGARLSRSVASPEPAERRFAAEVLAEARLPTLHRPLLSLLRDEDLAVRRAALRAAGRVGHPRLVPGIVSALGERELREAATAALLDLGDVALPAIDEALRAPGLDRGLARRLLRIAGRSDGRGATLLLVERLEHPSRTLRSVAGEALARRGYRARGEAALRCERALRGEGARVSWGCAALVDLREASGCELVAQALRQDVRDGEDAFLHLLSCLHPAGSVAALQHGLRSDSPDLRAQALEVLEGLAGAHRSLVVAVLDDVGPERRRELLAREFPQPRLAPDARLAEILAAGSPAGLWTRLCALHAVGRARLRELQRELDPYRSHRLEVVRETARWSWARCS